MVRTSGLYKNCYYSNYYKNIANKEQYTCIKKLGTAS